MYTKLLRKMCLLQRKFCGHCDGSGTGSGTGSTGHCY